MSYSLHVGESLALLREMSSESVDAVITDPPYSSGGAFRADRQVQTSVKYVSSDARKLPEFLGDNRDQRSYAYWSALWLGEALRVTRPGGFLCVFTDWRQLPTTTDAIQAGGWVWRGVVVWDKTQGARPRKGAFSAQAEYVVWGTRGPLDGERNPVTLPGVVTVPTERDKVHIAQKPVGVLRTLVKVAPPHGLVLDPFMGAGSTGIACLEEGRRFVGMEMDEASYAMAEERLEEAAARPSLFDAEEDRTQEAML